LDQAENLFKPVQFLIENKTYEDIYQEMARGIESRQTYEQRLLTYGRNETNIPVKSDLAILVDESLSPFYIFQVKTYDET